MQWICRIFVLLTLWSGLVWAQEALVEGADDNGFIINLLQDQLSTDSRKIRLSGVEGVLSSAATVARITISDTEGIWLQIENAQIVWTRSALLRGRVEVETLSAERIEVRRRPVPDPGLPDPAVGSFRVPELPVSVELGVLSVGTIALGEALLGTAAELQAEGRLKLVDGVLDAALQLNRLDGPGGTFDLAAVFDDSDQAVSVDLSVNEPQGGVAATLMGIKGAPPLETRIEARGSLADLNATLDFKVDGVDLLGGRVAVRTAESGRNFALGLTGRLQPLLPPNLHDFFAAQSNVLVNGKLHGDGGIDLSRLNIDSGGLQVQATASLAPDRFPDAIEATVRLAAPDGGALVLPLGDGTTTLRNGQFQLSFGGAERWLGFLQASDLTTGGVTLGDVRTQLGGLLQNPSDPAARRVTINVDGAVTEMSATDPGVAMALGEQITLALGLDWTAGNPLRIDTARIDGEGLLVDLVGALSNGAFSGRAALQIAQLATFSGIAGRELGGQVDTSVSGQVNPLTGAFSVTLDGSAQDLAVGVPQVDPLLTGDVQLAGLIARDEKGIRAERFNLSSDAAQITADGIYAAEGTDFSLAATLDDLGRVTPEVTGRARVAVQATGGIENLQLAVSAEMSEGTLRGRPLRDARVALTARGDSLTDLGGELDGGARIGEIPVQLGGEFLIDDDVQRLREFLLSVGDSQFAGTLARGADGLIAGTVDIAAPEIAEVADLLKSDASGAVDVRLVLSRSVTRQRARLVGRVRDLLVPQGSLGAADVDLTLTDVFAVPQVAGSLVARDAAANGFALDRLALTAEAVEDRSEFRAEATLENGTEASLAGAVSDLDPGLLVALDALRLQTARQAMILRTPAKLQLVAGEATLSPLDLSVGDGRLRVEGTYGATLSLDLVIEMLPLNLVNDVVPDVGAGGTVSGTARVSGTTAAPEATFSLSANDVTAAAARDLGVPPLTLTAEGSTTAALLDVQAAVAAGTALQATLGGQIPLTPQAGQIDVQLDLRQLSLSMLDPLIGDQGLVGTAAATAQVRGALAAPEVEFEASAQGLSARVLTSNGIGAASAQAQGRFADNTIDLQQATLRGSDNMQLTAQGQLPLSGAGLDVAASGRVPLSLANIALARSQAQANGTIDVAVTAQGALADPDLQGTARLRGGSFTSQPLNLRLDTITLDVRLADDRVTIETGTAALSSGGRITLGGNVGIASGSGFPADLLLQLRQGVYSDGEIFTTKANANLTLTGPILDGGQVTGNVSLLETEVTIPSSFGINAGVLLDVDHLNPPRDVVLTLDRAGLTGEAEADSGPGLALGLDIRVRVPNELFIRGRGLDAELGGRIRLRGTTQDIVPTGAIELIRGRINVLGQRIVFNEGTITLLGSFDPVIRLVAQTESGDATAISVIVEGPASDPQITFSSSPELPQDEVLALLIFDRNVSDLSPFQIAQLAAAAATLSGRGGNGLVEGLRGATGLADLDVTSGDDGAVGVRAGAYISENIYLNVEADSAGDSRATINLDITETVRGRVSLDNEGQSTLGIFFERDY